MTQGFDQVVDRRNTHSLKWTRYTQDVLPLWVADMDFPAPEPVRQALRATIDHGVFGYEMPSRGLTEAVVGRMHRLYGWEIAPEMVVATPGIVAGFNIAARAVCGPGEGIVVQPPVYRPFLQLTEQTGTVGQWAPLRQVTEPPLVRYEIDWQVFENSFHSKGARTAMFLLCQPHNPTGQIYSRSELERMAQICLRQEVVICSDEIHSELLLGGAQHTPMAVIDPEIARRSITLVSPSKTFNVVGLACGFAIIPDAGLRARYRAAQDTLALHVNALGLIAAEAAFSGGCESWLQELRQYLAANRDWVIEFVSKELPGVRTTRPDATYLAWLDFSQALQTGPMSPDPYTFLLDRAKVALNRGSDFGPGGESFARLNFGCPRSTLREALERIRKALTDV